MNMQAFLLTYGLFLAKFLTLILSGVFICFIIAVVKNSKEEFSNHLRIISLNEKFQEAQHVLQSRLLSKAAQKKWLKSQKVLAKQDETAKARLFVLRFDGDLRASQTKELRESISQIILVAQAHDEVLVVLKSPGGLVHSYGLAAAQLHRLRAKNIYFTVAIDEMAASGGYLMACVANRIVSAPFAIIGSIGVVALFPNFYRLLTKLAIDVEQHTAGEFKRTLTMFGQNTEQGRQKFQAELVQTHELFKYYIHQHRPQVDLDKLATGEHWHAQDALQERLIDDITTSDEFILEKLTTHRIYEFHYQHKPKLIERLLHKMQLRFEKFFVKT